MSADELLSNYRKRNIFFEENEIRSFASYYVFFDVQLNTYDHDEEELEEMLKDLNKQKESLLMSQPESEPLTSVKLRLSIVKAVMEKLDLVGKHIKTSLLKLALLEHNKLTATLQKLY